MLQEPTVTRMTSGRIIRAPGLRINCVSDEFLLRSRHSTRQSGEHKARTLQTRPHRGTLRLEGELSTVRKAFPPSMLTVRGGKKLLSRC
jgi:hypothetical protein